MIFIRSAFLIIVLMSLNTFAQTQPQASEQSSKPQAYKFDEFKEITIKNLEPRLRKFFIEIRDNCPMESCGTGNIVTFGPNEKRRTLLVKPIRYFLREHSIGRFMDRYDLSRITLIRVNDKNERTEFWFIPKGAEPPIFENAIP